MNINLSWDLFIIVFFGIIVAYSFIVGKDNNIKVILATYVSALCADAVGNLFSNSLALSGNFMKLMSLFGMHNEDAAIVVINVITFITFIVLLSVKGAYHIELERKGGNTTRLILGLIFGFLSACLIISIALIFISGASFIMDSSITASPAFQDIYGQSQIARILIDQYSLWFLLPAIAFLGISLFDERAKN